MRPFKHFRLIAALVGLAFTQAAMAQSSKDYALMGRIAWSAFECSSLASKSKNPEEQERLFRHGYEQGLKFIAAVRSGKVDRRDISEEVPLAVVLRLQGPTADFILGRVFEASQESALEKVYKTGEKFNSDELQETIARNELWKRNCQLIGTKK
jgi:hypothetical protein